MHRKTKLENKCEQQEIQQILREIESGNLKKIRWKDCEYKRKMKENEDLCTEPPKKRKKREATPGEKNANVHSLGKTTLDKWLCTGRMQAE